METADDEVLDQRGQWLLLHKELVVAALSMVATLIVASVTLYQLHQQEQQMSVVINDVAELRELMRKPLEGDDWYFDLDFDTYHGLEGDFYSKGEANFIWVPSEDEYVVQVWYSVHEEGSTEILATGVIEGSLRTDASGWPDKRFAINMDFLSRSAVERVGCARARTFSYDQGKISKSKDKRRAEEIKAYFNVGDTSGRVWFHR